MNTISALSAYCLRIADTNMILAQRLAEWCSRGPILEEDLAMTNISLDLLGQAEAFYDYAASLHHGGKTADDLAFLRTERQYFNNLLVEQPNGDFAQTMLKQMLVSAFQKHLFTALGESNDETIKGLSAKALKEVKYHFRHSSEWLIRLGNGTAESHQRCQFALNELWRFTDDMFEMNAVDEELISLGISCNMQEIFGLWKLTVNEILTASDLQIPEATNIIKGGYNHIHTEHLGHILCEMQYLQRAHPGAKW
jgi:ring-1,2-phenylacetyl-CoA epoxidase subunit PaaC